MRLTKCVPLVLWCSDAHAVFWRCPFQGRGWCFGFLLLKSGTGPFRDSPSLCAMFRRRVSVIVPPKFMFPGFLREHVGFKQRSQCVCDVLCSESVLCTGARGRVCCGGFAGSCMLTLPCLHDVSRSELACPLLLCPILFSHVQRADFGNPRSSKVWVVVVEGLMLMCVWIASSIGRRRNTTCEPSSKAAATTTTTVFPENVSPPKELSS